MKKFFILVMALSLGFLSCKKEKDEIVLPDLDPADVVGTWSISSVGGINEIVFSGGAEYETILKDSLAYLFKTGDVYVFNSGTSCTVTRGGAPRNKTYNVSGSTLTFDGYIQFSGALNTGKTSLALKAGIEECKVILKTKLVEKGEYSADDIDTALKFLKTATITLVFTKTS